MKISANEKCYESYLIHFQYICKSDIWNLNNSMFFLPSSEALENAYNKKIYFKNASKNL